MHTQNPNGLPSFHLELPTAVVQIDSLFKMTLNNKKKNQSLYLNLQYTDAYCHFYRSFLMYYVYTMLADLIASYTYLSDLLSEKERKLVISYKYSYKNCIN